MERPTRLDGAVPLDPASGPEIALAALTRRVAELEHRLDVMKVIVGLVLAAKVLIVVALVWILFGGLGPRGGQAARQVTRAADCGSGADSPALQTRRIAAAA